MLIYYYLIIKRDHISLHFFAILYSNKGGPVNYYLGYTGKGWRSGQRAVQYGMVQGSKWDETAEQMNMRRQQDFRGLWAPSPTHCLLVAGPGNSCLRLKWAAR